LHLFFLQLQPSFLKTSHHITTLTTSHLSTALAHFTLDAFYRGFDILSAGSSSLDSRHDAACLA
jgi:hypothetical protein